MLDFFEKTEKEKLDISLRPSYQKKLSIKPYQ